MSFGAASGAPSQPNDLEPYDGRKLEHRQALLATAALGVSILGGTEGVLVCLRERYHIEAGTQVAFDGLLIAAKQRVGNT